MYYERKNYYEIICTAFTQMPQCLFPWSVVVFSECCYLSASSCPSLYTLRFAWRTSNYRQLLEVTSRPELDTDSFNSTGAVKGRRIMWSHSTAPCDDREITEVIEETAQLATFRTLVLMADFGGVDVGEIEQTQVRRRLQRDLSHSSDIILTIRCCRCCC